MTKPPLDPRRVLFGLLCAVALVVLLTTIAAVAIWSQLQEGSAVREELHDSFELRWQTLSTFSLLQDAETGARGFVITGEKRFLEPYTNALLSLPRALDGLEERFVRRGERVQQFDKLEDVISARMQELSTVISLRESDVRSANERVLSGDGKALMDDIRVKIDTLIEAEAARLRALTTEQQRRVLRIRLILFSMLAAIAIVTIISAFGLALHLQERTILETSLREQERRVDGMRQVAHASSMASNFEDALRRTREVVSHMVGTSDAKALLVVRARNEISAIRLLDVGTDSLLPMEPPASDDVAIRRLTEVAWPGETGMTGLLRIDCGHPFSPEGTVEVVAVTSTDKRPTWRVAVPLDVGGEIAGLLAFCISDSSASKDDIDAFAEYVQSQLNNSAARQKALDTQLDALARQKAIFEAALDGVITVNESGTIETVNPAAERIFGVSGPDVVRRHVSIFFSTSEQTQTLWDMTDFISGRGAIRELMARRANGKDFPIELALGEAKLNDRRLYVAAIRDISERKRLERLKSEFVSTVSHELRTPLTSIAGSLGLLVGGAGGPLPAQASRLIDIARRNSERLVRLVNDILDIEKIESGEMRFNIAPTPLLPLIEAAIDANRGFAAEYDVNLILVPNADDIVVMADSDRLTQVITNLLSNAIKFSAKNSSVEVAIGRQGELVRLSVKDSGPGIPTEFRPRVFSKFSQADTSDTRKKGGTGLGLSIVKDIVDRLGGTVSFESAEGKGATFFVDLPYVKHAPRHSRSPPPSILICSDDVDAVRLLTGLFENARLHCTAVADPAGAHDELNRNSYLAALVDLGLPAGGAISFVRSLRANSSAAHVPVVLIGSKSLPMSDGDGLDGIPVVDWLDVPPDSARLVRSLRSAVGTLEKARPSVLHVDDDPDVLSLVKETLQDRAEVWSAATVADANRILALRDPDLAILDLMLMEGSALDLLPKLKTSTGQPIPVVVFSAQDADPALQARVETILSKSGAGLAQLSDTVRRITSINHAAR